MIVSISGSSGSGKSEIAKALVAELGTQTCARVAGDYYILPAAEPLDTYLQRPLQYDWQLLASALSSGEGSVVALPDFDFERFQRVSLQGDRTFVARKILVVDTMYPVPGADFTVVLTVPDAVRKQRIGRRDVIWGTDVAGRWPQLEESRRHLEQMTVAYDMVLSGLSDPKDTARLIAQKLATRGDARL